MNRLLALLTVGLVAGVAAADLAPPEGYKRVDGIHKITTEKDIEGYTFYKIEVPRKLAVAIKFDAKTPIVISDPGTRDCYELVAVPNETVKKYADPKELQKSLIEGEVPGMLRSERFFHCRVTVKNAHVGKSATTEYKFAKLDAKDGIVLTVTKSVLVDESKLSPLGGKGLNNDDATNPASDREPVSLHAPRGGMWVAGLAAFAAVMLGGFWLAGRTRRKV